MSSSGHGVVTSIITVFGTVDQHGGQTQHSSEMLGDVVRLIGSETIWTLASLEKDVGVGHAGSLDTHGEIAHKPCNMYCNELWYIVK